MSDAALRHIDYLASTIGPRGTCTPQERRAAEYCRQVLRDLGYEPQVQPFRAARSGWAPFSIASGLMLLALLLPVLLPAETGRPAAALLAVAVVVSVFLQLTFRPNPLARLVPRGDSQNVYAVAEPRGEPRRTLVVSGHVDTHRTPVAMASPQIFRLFQALITLGVVSFVALAALLVLVAVLPGVVLWPLAALPAAVVVVVFAVTLQPEFTPFVPGANDNASGAAAVLALAVRLKREPLAHARV